jgi:hypothetical protein
VSVVAQILVGNLITLVLSIGTTLVSVGMRWGKLDADVQSLSKQVAEIRGMFALRLKDLGEDGVRKAVRFIICLGLTFLGFTVFIVTVAIIVTYASGGSG